jgi:hypothetical protein
MTTPTTNFGWLKAQPTEKAKITGLNTAMDDMDADIKTVSDAKSAKIYSVGQYRVIRQLALAASGVVTLVKDVAPFSPVLEEVYSAMGNTGNWTVDPMGAIQLTQAGIYRLTLTASIYAYGATTTSGYVYSGLQTVTPTEVAKTGKMQRLNTQSNNNWCTSTNTMFLSTAVNVATSTNYYIGLAQHTTGGAIGVSFDPEDSYPYDIRFTLECLRSL